MPALRRRASSDQPSPSRPRSAAPAAADDTSGPEPGAVRVLLLDDDPGVGRAVKLIVEAAGMECISVTRVDEFFRTIESWEPTHLLLDLMMPGMDGVEVMSSLGKSRCDAYVLLISGLGTQVLEAAKRTARVNGLNVIGTVAKPFSAAKLVDALRRGGTAGTAAGPGGQAAAAFVVTDADIERAIRRNEFTLAYQPKVRCDTGALVGFEVLIRWNHPQYGTVAPDAFIPLAEKSGRVVSITRLVLEQALEWLSHYEDLRATLSINVSAHCLRDPDFTDHLIGLCGHFGVEPSRLVLELTETAATEDPVAAVNSLTRLRLRGVALAIDDFGTGYSSMAQLAQLPFSEIKIDKSFVMPAGRSERARSIIQSTVSLGRKLDLRVTAEGVESNWVFEFLREIGCDFAQGFLISRPLDGESARVWQTAGNVAGEAGSWPSPGS